jgi:hemerythrin-like domain-containing protein
MLASESAWRVLRAEHARLRDLLASIAAARQREQWKALPALIQSFRAFEDATHRPKGVVLLATLRGRSAEADGLLDSLEGDSERCDALLMNALALLDRIEGGDEQAGAQCAAVLETHRELMLAHLEREDTLLHSHTARLLTPEEWSRVVSSISSVVRSASR